MDNNKKIMQQKLLEYQLLQQHIENLQQQLQFLNQQVIEIAKLNEDLSSLENSKQGKEIFSQLGPGIYVKADLKESKNVLFNIGSGILVNKTVKEANSLLGKQQEEIFRSITELEEQFKKVFDRVQELQEEIKSLQASS